MKPEEFKNALAEALVERGVPKELASTQVERLFSAMNEKSARLIGAYDTKESLAPIADELAAKLLPDGAAPSVGGEDGDKDDSVIDAVGYYASDNDFYATGDYYIAGAESADADGSADADDDGADAGIEPDVAGIGSGSRRKNATDALPFTVTYADDGDDGASQTDDDGIEYIFSAPRISDEDERPVDIDDAPTATVPAAGARETAAPSEAQGLASDGGYHGATKDYYGADDDDIGVSRVLTPEEMRQSGLAPADDIDEYAPDDATLTKMGLSMTNYEAEAIENDKTKRDLLSLPELPEIVETADGRRSFIITAICLSPLLTLAALLYFGAWGVVFAAEAALIAALVAALVAVSAGGVFASMAGIVYGIVKFSSQRSEGIFEIGLGVAAAGATLLCAVLIYNLALRFMPWAIRKTARLCRFVTRKAHILILNIRGRFSAK